MKKSNERFVVRSVVFENEVFKSGIPGFPGLRAMAQ